MQQTPPHYGELLKAARTGAGLTQRALADKAGTTGPTVHRIEAGQIEPRDELRVRLASALGTTAAELFPYPDSVPA